MTYTKTTKELLDFIRRAPTAYQTVEELSCLLDKSGFQKIAHETNIGASLVPCSQFYVTQDSSLIAVRVPQDFQPVFSIMASHGDSPTFKIKDFNSCKEGIAYQTLETERYGGTILSTWLDRPLSLAGRAIIANKKGSHTRFESRSVVFDRDLLVIPNVAIHLQPKLNDGYVYQPAIDFNPLFSAKGEGRGLRSLTADLLDVCEEDVVDADLFIYNRTPGCIFGANQEFFSSPRVDNLQCAYASFQGFLNAALQKNIAVYAIFDHEEIGSSTRAGAASSFLHDTLSLISENLNFNLRQAIASSIMFSVDNAHALHPNHPELNDTKRAPVLNGGIVLKRQASQRYTTSALSAALVHKIAEKAGVPSCEYANRSDIVGGSTLGAIATTKVGMLTADIGLPQLSMHSSYETGGSFDTDYMIRFSKTFYESDVLSEKEGVLL